MTVKDILFGVNKSTTVPSSSYYLNVGTYYSNKVVGKIVSDSSNNVYFLSNQATSDAETAYDALLNKVDASGTGIFQIYVTTNLQFHDLILDSIGNIYVTGMYTTTGYPVIFKYNSSGVLQWCYKINASIVGSATYPSFKIAIDSNNYV